LDASSAGTLLINIVDDEPTIDPINSFLDNSVDNSVTATLNLVKGADDATVVLTPKTNLDGYLLMSYGDELSEIDQLMTSGGEPIEVSSTTPDGGFIVSVVDTGSNDNAGNEVFRVTVNADGTYTVLQTGILDGTDAAITFSLSDGIKGGNSDDFFLLEPGLVYDDVSVDDDLLDNNDYFGPSDPLATVIHAYAFETLSPGNSLTVNSSDFSLAVDSGQDIADGETLVLDFTTANSWELQDLPGNQNDGIVESGTFTLVDLNSISIGLRSFNLNEIAIISLYNNGVKVADVQILNDVADFTNSSTFITIGQSGVESFDGLETSIIWYPANTPSVFDSVQFTAGADDNYKLTSIQTTETTSGIDQSLEITATATDGDLDEASDTFTVTFDGTGPIQGTDAGESISGGTGDDVIFGEGGNDIITGGLGNDILTGGTGQDEFVWNAGDEGASGAVDTIKDFQVGPSGDVLNLADLLDGETEGTLDQFLAISVNNGDTTIAIDVDGLGGPGTVFQTIVLEGVDLSDPTTWGEPAGSDLNQAEMIANLLTNNNIITD